MSSSDPHSGCEGSSQAPEHEDQGHTQRQDGAGRALLSLQSATAPSPFLLLHSLTALQIPLSRFLPSQHGLCVHLGLGLAATDQVTHQQETPTHCAKTETAGGKDIGSSDLLPKQDPGSRLGGGVPTAHPEKPGGAHWNQNGLVWGQKRAQTDGWSSSDHRV